MLASDCQGALLYMVAVLRLPHRRRHLVRVVGSFLRSPWMTLRCDIYLCSILDWITLFIRKSHRGGMDTMASSAVPGDGSGTSPRSREKPAIPASLEPIQGPLPECWREQVLTRAKELEALRVMRNSL